MTTVTLTLDDAAAAKARQVAERRNSSLEDMLKGFVVKLSQDDSAEAGLAHRESMAQILMATFRDLGRPLNGKGYSVRDELYER